MVPGIVYGGDNDPLPIQIPFNELLKKLKADHDPDDLFSFEMIDDGKLTLEF